MEYGIWNLTEARVTSRISNHADFKIPNFKKWGFQNGDLWLPRFQIPKNRFLAVKIRIIIIPSCFPFYLLFFNSKNKTSFFYWFFKLIFDLKVTSDFWNFKSRHLNILFIYLQIIHLSTYSTKMDNTNYNDIVFIHRYVRKIRKEMNWRKRSIGLNSIEANKLDSLNSLKLDSISFLDYIAK